jgi:hypothetical protein
MYSLENKRGKSITNCNNTRQVDSTCQSADGVEVEAGDERGGQVEISEVPQYGGQIVTGQMDSF